MNDRPEPARAKWARFAWLVGAPGSKPGERAMAVLTVVVVAYGLYLRAHGYLWQAPALWLDECSWAMYIVEQSLIELCIRPIGFMWLSRLLAHTFSLTEPVLRFMPWVAGMAGVVLAPSLAGRLFKNPGARFLFVAILALHPCAIDFSKEFKPYSVSLTLHLSLLLLALRYLDSGRRSHLWWALGTAFVGGLFAQDLVFAYPGFFLVLGWSALRERREHLRPIVVVAGLIILALVLQYVFLWSQVHSSDANEWGEKYNIFYTEKRGHHFFSWFTARYEDMTGFPGFRRRSWRPGILHGRRLEQVRTVDYTIWLVLHFLGLLVLAFKRRSRAVLLVLPIVALWAFNLLKFWPVGAFRANLFVIAYMAAIACMALDLPARPLAKLRDAIPALVLVILPFALLDPAKSATKSALTYNSEFPKALRALLAAKLASDPSTRETLVLDRRACDPFRYYTEFHPVTKRRFYRQFRAQFDVQCVKEDKPLKHAIASAIPTAPHHVWLLLHAPRDVVRMIRRRELGHSELTYQDKVGNHTVMAFWRPPGAAPEPGSAGPASDKGATPEEEAPDEEPDHGGRF